MVRPAIITPVAAIVSLVKDRSLRAVFPFFVPDFAVMIAIIDRAIAVVGANHDRRGKNAVAEGLHMACPIESKSMLELERPEINANPECIQRIGPVGKRVDFIQKPGIEKDRSSGRNDADMGATVEAVKIERLVEKLGQPVYAVSIQSALAAFIDGIDDICIAIRIDHHDRHEAIFGGPQI